MAVSQMLPRRVILNIHMNVSKFVSFLRIIILCFEWLAANTCNYEDNFHIWINLFRFFYVLCCLWQDNLKIIGFGGKIHNAFDLCSDCQRENSEKNNNYLHLENYEW